MTQRAVEDVAVRTLEVVSQGHVMDVMNRLIVERLSVLLYALTIGAGVLEVPALMNLLQGLPVEEKNAFIAAVDVVRGHLEERDIYELVHGRLTFEERHATIGEMMEARARAEIEAADDQFAWLEANAHVLEQGLEGS